MTNAQVNKKKNHTPKVNIRYVCTLWFILDRVVDIWKILKYVMTPMVQHLQNAFWRLFNLDVFMNNRGSEEYRKIYQLLCDELVDIASESRWANFYVYSNLLFKLGCWTMVVTIIVGGFWLAYRKLKKH